jgi:hypothetical protein
VIVEPPPEQARVRAWRDPGVLATAMVALALLGFALSVDFPRAAHGFKGDEATYYSLTYSLARDRDFAFTRNDLIRVWDEFSTGPEGIFLKRGRHVSVETSRAFPWLTLRTSADTRDDRLYYGKSFIYPLVAAPFVFLLGTSGFLVLHALLLTLCVAAAIAWLRARGSGPLAAVTYALAFFGASVVPVYFVWLTPEIFNFSAVLFAFFLWGYKERAPALGAGRVGAFLRGPGSDVAAAALLGIATFSKPIHLLLIPPLVMLALWRRQWWRGIVIAAAFVAVTAGLFLANLAATGEANYQGGERRTFYGQTGFPFANEWERFENTGLDRATDKVPIDVLFNRDTLTVFRHNVGYFAAGRYSGLLPYFFPGLVSLVLFLVAGRQRQLWQWLTGGVAILAATALIVYMPYTYSGGGGPIGNRYYLSFYPLFLFLTPALATAGPALAAWGVGALFTAKLVLNPFYTSFNPGEHVKHGPLRLLPIELTLLNDLPVSAKPERSRQPFGGERPLLAYFPDDNAYNREGDGFWVRGRARTDVILRAPAWDGPDGPAPLRLKELDIEVQNGAAASRVRIVAGRTRRTLDLEPGQIETLRFRMREGVPYRPSIYPTNYVYTVSLATTGGFVPFLEVPGASDSRVLGARIRMRPIYDPDPGAAVSR